MLDLKVERDKADCDSHQQDMLTSQLPTRISDNCTYESVKLPAHFWVRQQKRVKSMIKRFVWTTGIK